MTILDYLDALAGAGKTRWIANPRPSGWAILGFKVLIVQPSKLLIAKTVSDELAKLSPVRHKIIDGDHGDPQSSRQSSPISATHPLAARFFSSPTARSFSVPFLAHQGSVDRPDGRSARGHRLPRTALARQ
jgi:hypothetical protein